MRALGDLRIAGRSLARTPGFTAVVVLTLGIGIGASTAIFSIVHAVILRPLAYPAPHELVRVTSELRGLGAADTGVAPAELADYQRHTDVFAGAAGTQLISANATAGGAPERVEMLLVTWNYFAVLGIAPAHGRVFGAADDTPGVAGIAVVSDGYWRRRLGADPAAVGTTMILDGDPVAIVGVMPRGFRHPGRTAQSEIEVWSPAGFLSDATGATRSRRSLDAVLARLQPGLTPAQAQARLDDYAAGVRQRHPGDYPPAHAWNPRVIPLQSDLVSSVSAAMFIVAAGVGLLLLIACVNVANLVLARSTGRRQEVLIRLALGAGVSRLARQYLTESAMLAFAGAGVGLLVAAWTVRGLLMLAPSRVVQLADVTIDATALILTAAIALVATVIFGVLPALQIRGVRAAGAIREGGRGSIAAPGAARARRWLVGAEVALATVLLVGAGLFVRTVTAMLAVSPGFETERLLTARLELPRPNDPGNDPTFRQRSYFDPERRVRFVHEALARIAALPDVERVAMSSQVPLGGFQAPLFFEIDGRARAADAGSAVIHSFQVSTGYFETVGVPVTGRAFAPTDRSGAEPVAIVSESAVRAFWGGGPAVGSRIRLGPDVPWMTVIGVAGDIRHRRLTEPPQPMLYRPLDQASTMSLAMLVRTRSVAPAGVADALAREVRAVDPQIPLYGVRSMDDLVDAAVAQRRFLMRLLVAFGAIALGLALLGIYGVLAHAVSQRRREIGVRLAIGASGGRVAAMVLRQGMTLVAAGAATGLVLALVLARFAGSQLFGVRPSDPLTLLVVAVLMLTVAAGAAFLPARRAARIDPIAALRE